ncbi:MAG: response regulator [Bacteroidia bacterium]
MTEDILNIRILYVDDEENNLKSFHATFRRDFEIHTAVSVDDALIILQSNDIHVLITDQRMPGKLGTDFLQISKAEFPLTTRLLLTGYSDMEALTIAVNSGEIFRYLQKPWEMESLKKTINESYLVHKFKKEQLEKAEKLQITNEQLEFMLRQKLIS